MSEAHSLPRAVACPSCGALIDGRFCAACGQRAPAADDFTARRFFGAAWRELSDGDSRTLRTLRALLVPGELTRAFAAHEWRRYLPPLRLYLVVSGVFFLLCWDTYHQMASAQLDPKLWLAQVPPDKHEAALAAWKDPRVADRASDLTALLRFLGVLAMGAVVALLQHGLRRPFGMHLVFATHYYVFDYLLFTLAAPLFVLLPRIGHAHAAAPAIWVLTLLLFAWAVTATRRVYARGWAGALGAGVAILLADLMISSLAGQVGFGLAIGLGIAEQQQLIDAAAAAAAPAAGR